MEIGGREILIGLGVLLVIAILLDGFRRVRGGGTGKLRVRRRKQPIFDDDEFDDASSELPGTARVVEVRDEQSAEQLSRTIKEKAAKDHTKLTVPFRQPEQELLGFNDIDPQPAADHTAKVTATQSASDRQSEQQQDKQDVIVLHVMAPAGEQFCGGDLLDVLMKNGLRYGSQKIFHRHEQEDGAGNVLFSMTNSVNPGVFELSTMADFETPGVSFFMVMQDSEDPMVTFELLLQTVDAVKEALGGELKDEDRCALTRQTAEHYRQRIMDYNRRQLTG